MEKSQAVWPKIEKPKHVCNYERVPGYLPPATIVYRCKCGEEYEKDVS